MSIEIGTRKSDFFAGTPDADFIDGRGGDDFVFGGFSNDTLLGGAGDDTLSGSIDDDVLLGGAGNDQLNGGEDDDFLSGGAGRDSLRGDSGSRSGVDLLEGGRGADVFVFAPLVPVQTAIADTGSGEGRRDVILDFGNGRDVIDLSAYVQSFGPFGSPGESLFLGTGAFVESDALQVRYDVLAGERAVVQFRGVVQSGLPAGVDPGPRLEGEIELIGVHRLTAEDFILA